MNPLTDPRLTPPERAVFGKIYPEIKRINKELGEQIEFLLLVNLARRLVTLGKAPDEIVEAVRHAAYHQQEHNANSRREH